MIHTLALCLCMLLSPAAMAAAGDTGVEKQVAAPLSGSGGGQMAPAGSVGDETSVTKPVEEDEKTADPGELKEDQGSETKEMSGMSIVGNEEAPKSLYIVPWKSSERYRGTWEPQRGRRAGGPGSFQAADRILSSQHR